MSEGPGNSVGRRVLRTLLRLAFVLLIGTAIGAGAYFGLPLAYRGLVEPVRLNAERIQDLEADLERNRTDLAGLAERTGQRTADLEASNVEIRESLSELQAGLDNDLGGLERQLDQLAGQLDGLDRELNLQGQALEQALADPVETDPALLRQLTITRALLHLMRARLWLIENNLGLAAEQVQAARAALDGVEGVALAVARLDQALAELQATPLVAADDLEIAWRLLTSEPEDLPVEEN